MSMTDLQRYARDIECFTVYPESGTGSPMAIAYCVLGLNGEMAEMSESTPSEFSSELGDVFWYLARLCVETGVWPDEPKRPARWEMATVLNVNAGKVAEIAKKHIRDGKPVEMMRPLITDIYEGLAWLATNSTADGVDLQAVLTANVSKLSDRAARGVLNGNGDHR